MDLSIDPERSIVVELPTPLLQIANEIAEKRKISLSQLGREILEHGRTQLPYRISRRDTETLTFWVRSSYYQLIKNQADASDTYMKSLIQYWFIACLTDAKFLIRA